MLTRKALSLRDFVFSDKQRFSSDNSSSCPQLSSRSISSARISSGPGALFLRNVANTVSNSSAVKGDGSSECGGCKGGDSLSLVISFSVTLEGPH